jgi:La-related protein 7
LECSKLQVEYYFSDENLPTDEFLLKFVKKNKEAFGKYTI